MLTVTPVRIAFLVTVLVLVTLTAAAGLLWHSAETLLRSSAAFERTHLFESYFLYDLGLADVNDDQRLDIFTTNHSAQQHILVARENNFFSPNVLSDIGLDQTPEFPGLSAGTVLPDLKEPGLYISLYRSAIVVRSYVFGDIGLGHGEISFPWPATAASKGKVLFHLQTNRKDSDAVDTRVAFTSEGEGELLVEPQPAPTDGFPIHVSLKSGVDLQHVYVGPRGIHPPDNTFVLTPKDRHGMAWADYNADGRTDVFISRGGIRGLGSQIGNYNDELFVGDVAGFRNQGDQAQIAKHGCPGRQAAWVDVDRDNRLDLYLSCGRTSGPREQTPNMLYRQLPDGSFVNVAQDLGVAIPGYGTFKWFDIDSDGDSDLLWAGRTQISLYRNRHASFAVEEVAETPRGPASRLAKFAVSDFDADCDLDVFFASRDGNLLLINEAGSLRPQSPGVRGLPQSAHTATWVDFDNDGLLDLAVVPAGIYRQTVSGRFEATGFLESKLPALTNDGRASWLDVNLDGTLDAVIAVRPCWPGRLCAAEEKALTLARRWLEHLLQLRPPGFLFASKRWHVELYRGRPTENHWLAVDVVGPQGNRTSIGAHLRLQSPSRTLVAEVGQLEGSHHSQGNYRLHFGLGRDARIDAIDVLWPDGMSVTKTDFAVNRLVRIEHPRAHE